MTTGLVIAVIIIATVSGMLSARREENVQVQDRVIMIRSITYWLFTILIAFELAAGALWDLFRIEYVRVVLTHLGYPAYLLVVLGAWRIPGALVLLVPRFPRLKEWVYAGAFFEYTGAAASHLLVGDSANQWMGPVICAVFAMLSWALRPARRRLPGTALPAPEKPVMTWAVPILTVVVMLVVGYFTLPKGAPPQ